MMTSIPAYDQFPFHGVYSALVTPLDNEGKLDCAKLQQFVDYLIGQGVYGLIPLGSTGEYYALNEEERECVVRCTLEAAAGRVPVIAGTNAGGTREVIAFSQQAEQLGCAGVMLAAPYYSVPTDDELFLHFQAIDAAIGVPIMLYNYPARTGVDLGPALIERLASLANIQYVKESSGDMTRITQLLRRCGDRLGIFCGCDTLALESFVAGAIGWVGGVVNAMPADHIRLFEAAMLENDYLLARRRFYQMLPLLELMEDGGKYTQWVKAACRLQGHDVGDPRPPLAPATPAEIDALRAALGE